jgi:hypothetical protein
VLKKSEITAATYKSQLLAATSGTDLDSLDATQPGTETSFHTTYFTQNRKLSIPFEDYEASFKNKAAFIRNINKPAESRFTKWLKKNVKKSGKPRRRRG